MSRLLNVLADDLTMLDPRSTSKDQVTKSEKTGRLPLKGIRLDQIIAIVS